MARLVTDVLDFLEAEGLVGGASGWVRATDYLPPDPDKIIAVFPTPGLEPELIKDGSAEQKYDDLGFQVRGRAEAHDWPALEARMGQVFRALHGSTLAPSTGDPAYVLIRAVQSGPLPLGLDQGDRPGMSWNFVAIREREA